MPEQYEGPVSGFSSNIKGIINMADKKFQNPKSHDLKREQTSEPMKPGPILIIRNTFPLHLPSFIFSAINKSENKKILLLLAITHINPKTITQPCISSSLHIYLPNSVGILIFICVLFYLVATYLLYHLFIFIIFVSLLIRNFVLDNHLVELGTQGILFVFQIARRGERIINFPQLVPRKFDITLESPLWGKEADRKSTRLNSSHSGESRMPSSA